MVELEAQANHVWKPGHGVSAMAVSDFDRIVIPPNPLVPAATLGGEADEGIEIYEDAEAGPSTYTTVSERSRHPSSNGK